MLDFDGTLDHIRLSEFNEWRACLRGMRLKRSDMAKATTIKIKLVSTADTGFYYVTKKNSRTQTEKLTFRKYDPVVRKHVDFKEAKIK